MSTNNGTKAGGPVSPPDFANSLFGGMDKEALCLPTGQEDLASDADICDAINKAAKILWFVPSEKHMACLKVFQNNEHHLEGWLYNHVILMLYALRYHGQDLSNAEYEILESAIFYSDLGKSDTKKDSPKKVWEDGTPQSTAFGHAEVSAKMHKEQFPNGELFPNEAKVNYLVAEHMNAHQMESQYEKVSKHPGYEWLISTVDEDSWTWPAWDEIEWPHGKQLSKKQFAWAVRCHNPLLHIKRACDEAGRISEVSF